MVVRLGKFGTAALASCAMSLVLTSPTQAGGPVNPVQGDVSPLYGKINPFYGDVNASYGKINPFYGKINPFYGKINPFWGDVSGYYGKINPFTADTSATTVATYGSRYDPFWGKDSPYAVTLSPVQYSQIAGFWQGELANWTSVQATWATATTLNDAQNLANQIQNTIINPAINFWGQAVQRGLVAPDNTSSRGLPGMDPSRSGRKGLSLTTAEMNWLSPSGVTFTNGVIDPASLLKMDPSQRAMMFLNLYDDLMDYSGTGHVDWWMGSAGWTPALAGIQGSGASGRPVPTVGMIDFAISSGVHLSKQITQFGSTTFNDGHGAAVGSLIMGSVDGSGILGVMPQSSVNVVVYDPYDATNTTNWTDVGTGVAALTNAIFKGRATPLGVINASLGEPGYTLSPGWNDALRNAGAYGHNLVIAAGNDGGTQTQNVVWDFNANPTLLIVGSVGVDGTISNFSNRPGEACLIATAGSACSEANKLKYHFIVAPGELILVSDGLGGHIRQSGTSLAAPFVSGAIAMLQNRWPWLSNYPDETAQIILKSATPKGAHPGADPIYGVGELNIAASQSPLNWNNMVFYQATSGRVSTTAVPLSTVATQIRGGTQSSWDASGLWYSAFETIGATYRDFQIPLSSKLVGLNASTAAGMQAYQSNLTMALRSHAIHYANVGASNLSQDRLVSGFARSTVPAGQFAGMQLRVSVTPAQIGNAFQMRSARYDTDALLVGDKASFAFGYGNGAAALDGSAGFAFRTDYDLGQGGANPLLGLASGGAYMGGRAMLADRLTIGFGTTDRMARRNLSAFGIDRSTAGDWVNRYAAQAQTVSLAYRIGDGLTARVGFTRLHEDAALLGIQSLDRGDLQGGSVTDGASAGFDLTIGGNWMLAATGTITRTRADAGQIRANGLTSASAELAVIRSRLLARNDELRLTLASPLHTIGGHLVYSSVGVIDRSTGAIGVVEQAFAPRGRLPLAGQAMYGLALPRAKGEFSFFGRVDREAELIATHAIGYSGGVQLHLAF